MSRLKVSHPGRELVVGVVGPSGVLGPNQGWLLVESGDEINRRESCRTGVLTIYHLLSQHRVI